MLQRDALPGPRVTDDHHRLRVGHEQREAHEHRLRAEGLVQVLELDHRSSTRAQNASSTRSKTAEYTTALVVLAPTPSAPPRVLSPTMQPTSVIVKPKVALLNNPNQVSLKR